MDLARRDRLGKPTWGCGGLRTQAAWAADRPFRAHDGAVVGEHALGKQHVGVRPPLERGEHRDAAACFLVEPQALDRAYWPRPGHLLDHGRELLVRLAQLL